jgi:hypothetical protein
MGLKIAVALILTFVLDFAKANQQHHLIFKSDFNDDGIADRVGFASKGISGFFQSTNSNKKIDTFLLKQGNKTIFFTSSKTLGGPFLKLTESSGFFTTVSILTFENNKFQHTTSYIVPDKVYFSQDPFADPFEAAPASKSSSNICEPNDVFANKATSSTLSWAEAINKFSVEETIKKAISPECKTVFGKSYEKVEKQILSACGVTTGSPEKNDLVNCLDEDPKTRFLGGYYKTSLAANIFDDGFKISCAKSSKDKPLASLNNTSNSISLFQVSPENPNRNFKADFFHEMLHNVGVENETTTEKLVEKCVGKKTFFCSDKKNKAKDECKVIELSEVTKKQLIENKKDGTVVNIPPAVRTVPQTTVATAVNEGSKALDNDFSMDNATQYKALSNASKATFKSFEPLMTAAYSAAVPSAFAQNTVASATNAKSVAFPTTKAVASATSRAIASSGSSSPSASGATYDISSLPESVPASAKGDLGNGMAVKASEVAFDANAARSPASSEVAAPSAASGGSVGPSIAGSLASIKTTDRPDLRANVPQLKAEEDFLKTLTTGKYDEVKAKLVDPKNQRILEEKKIQYVAKDKTLGSKQPVIILKDLGNKFTVLRVNVE